MSGILLVWANLPESALDWYENEYIQAMCTKHAKHALHCEETSNGMEEEGIGKLTCPWKLMTLYEIPVIATMTRELYDPSNQPPAEMFTGVLKGARFDVRAYKEVRKWLNEDWDETGT